MPLKEVIMKNIQILLLVCSLFLLSRTFVLGEDCRKAIELYNQGTAAKNILQRETLFMEALASPCGDAKIQARIHNNLADAYENQGKLKEAIAEYKKAIELDADLPTPYVSLGDVYSKLKEDKTAVVYYQKYWELSRFKTRVQLTRSLKRGIYVTPSQGESGPPREDLYFGFNETVLSRESEKQLKELLATLSDNEFKGCRFLLGGHTCNIGTEAYNRKLSEARARAVKTWLVDNGIAGEKLEVVGLGKTKPFADNRTEAGRKLNRRVEIRRIDSGS
jgi:outer membrane protein OmpA-like peptidoglycan-associated protein